MHATRLTFALIATGLLASSPHRGQAESPPPYACAAPRLRLIETIAAPNSTDLSFGYTLEAAGTDLLIGAPYRTAGGVITGVVYRMDPTSGDLLTTYDNPSSGDAELFGWGLAADTGSVYVGALNSDVGATTHAGRAHRFDRESGDWVQSYDADTPIENGQFGASLALLDGDLLVASPEANQAYRLDATTGDILATYEAPAVEHKAFGFSLAATNGHVVVGDYEEGTAIHIYDASTGDHELDVEEGLDDGAFGMAIAAQGEAVFVTSWSNRTAGGAAYRIDPATGGRDVRLGNPSTHAGFGVDIVGIGDNVAISAINEEGHGVVYLFGPNGGLLQVIENPDPNDLYFGFALAAVDGQLVVSAPLGPGMTPGKVYVFGESSCGDGNLDTGEGESCDDGNLVDGDGCSSLCQDDAVTYDANARAWNRGQTPLAIIPHIDAIDTEAMTITLLAAVADSCGRPVTQCGYQFGDASAPVWVAVVDGTCEPATHTYDQHAAFVGVVQASTAAGPISQAPVLMDLSDPAYTISDPTPMYITWGDDECLYAVLQRPVPVDPDPNEPAASTPRPTIVEYGPYSWDGQFHLHLEYMVKSGYNYLHVEHRGQGLSCGRTNPFSLQDQEDLTQIAGWLEGQDWANGDFCLVGYSGPAFMGGLALSRNQPSNLKCAVLGGGSFDWFDGGATKNGAHWPTFPLWTLTTYFDSVDLDRPLRMPGLLNLVIEQHSQTKSAFWQERDLRDEVTDPNEPVNVPLLIFTSSEDSMSGTRLPYVNEAEGLSNADSAVFLYTGPHTTFDATLEHPASVIQGGNVLAAELRQFFDHFLVSPTGFPIDTDTYNIRYAIERGGPQAALVNGRTGGWATSSTWPPPEVEPLALYFDTTAANSIDSRGDYSLAASPPTDGTISFPYEAPDVWAPVIGHPSVQADYTFPDMRPLERKAFTFTSGPIQDATTLGYEITLHVRADSTLYDWDWMVMLDDVWPDGSVHSISYGFLRASARDGLNAYHPAPDGMQDYTIPLSEVVNTFDEGHRLRLALYQVNTSDTAPSEATTEIDLTASWLEVYAASTTTVPEPAACLGPLCDPAALPLETFRPRRAIMTLGFEGHTSESEPASTVRVAGYVRDGTRFDPVDGPAGRFFVELPGPSPSFYRCTLANYDGNILDVGDSGVTLRLDCDGDAETVELELTATCDREGHPNGTVSFSTPSLGALIHTRGRVQCYDTPFANLKGDF